MPLADLWRENKAEFESKNLAQLVPLAGDGNIADNSTTSHELRSFFDVISSDFVKSFAEQCLVSQPGVPQSGLVLQDLINQMGKRLGFGIQYGRYKGVKGQSGHDGIWTFPNEEYQIVVEVKTTDAYRVDLDRIAQYRYNLIQQEQLTTTSSILLVVGREDTGGLESQVRGSKHAWDVRLISIDALSRLMKLREDLEDPSTLHRIHNLLKPREFTKLDEIIDLVFFTATEVKQVEAAEPDEITHVLDTSTPASFHDACIQRAEICLETTLIRRSKAKYASHDGSIAVTCHVSKYYERPGYQYWFAFHPHQSEFLESTENSFILFGCGSPAQVLLIPFTDFHAWLDQRTLNVTERGEGFYYHIQITNEGSQFWLVRRKGLERIDLTEYLI